MDDGSLNRNHLDISTYSFSELEINLLQKVLKKNFRLTSNYYKDRDKGYRMYFSIGETKNLIKLIKPFIIPSLNYKISLKTP